MNYLEINGERFGSNDLIGFLTNKLTEIGVNNFQSININTASNQIDIQFGDIIDANIARAIAGSPQSNKHQFQTKDARHFLLALFETTVQAGLG